MKSCGIKIIWKSMFERKDEELRGWKHVAFGMVHWRVAMHDNACKSESQGLWGGGQPGMGFG